MKRTPIAHGTQNGCFGCGLENESGLRLEFHPAEDGGVIAHFEIDPRFMGPPAHAHGGIIATILDEAMSKANRIRGVFAMTRQMEVEFLRPVPLLTALEVRGHSETAGARKHGCTAAITDAKGHTLARAKGLFIEVKPERLLHRQTEPPVSGSSEEQTARLKS